MLQQTGVKTVGPYFEKFLARWPDVGSLGRASQDDVLRVWAEPRLELLLILRRLGHRSILSP